MSIVYAIGATALTGGTEGCLDAVYVDAIGSDPGIGDGYVAFVTVQGDATYHYIADADSGAEADGIDVVKPLWSSPGVDYDGDLRWILHDVYPVKAHAATHTDGTDDIRSATSEQKGLATAAQIDKLDGIEEGATADQTGAEIKALYEAEADTNAYTDAEKSKLSGIESGADVTDADNVAAAGAVMTETDPVFSAWDKDYDDLNNKPTLGSIASEDTDTLPTLAQADGAHFSSDEIRARDGDGLKLYDDGGAGIFVKDGGNVGIGTTSPGQKFEVNIGTNNIGMLLASTDAVCKMCLQDSGSSNLYSVALGAEGDNMTFSAASSGAERMRILGSNGYVGIGTTLPGYKLEVTGNVYVSGDVSALTFTDRTKFFDGDALAAIKGISGKDGETDHSTLPEFARRTLQRKETDPTTGEEVIISEEPGRDLGAMISILTKAVQELTAKVEALEAKGVSK